MEDEQEQFLTEMQMTLTYAGSPLVGERATTAGVRRRAAAGRPGTRRRMACVASGSATRSRLFELTRGTAHTLLLYADESVDEETVTGWEKLADAAREQSFGMVETCLVVSPDAVLPAVFDLPVYRDSDGMFQRTYDVGGTGAYLIRPDGHVGFRSTPVTQAALQEHLEGIFAS